MPILYPNRNLKCHRRRTLALTLAAATVLTMAACASEPVPTGKMAVAEASVKHATTSSTSDSAAAELQLATDKLAAARQALTSKNYERAGQLAEQADVDAQVAELHAQSARSRKAAQESQDAARVLREEITRDAPR
jgi:hypothetical protein